MPPQTAANEIHEDQLLNFLVNVLIDRITIDLGENAAITAEEIWDVLIGATVSGRSITNLSARSEDAPSANAVLYHLRTKFDLETIRQVGNTLVQAEIGEVLPDDVEVVVDFHLRPYYGDEEETDGLYHSEAKAGTTAFHAFATLYARVRNKRYTLAVRRVTDGDTASQVLAAFLGLLSDLPIDVKAVFLDREFYNSGCLALLQAHNYAYVMPVVAWGSTIQSELDQGWSRQIEHSLSVSAADPEWTVEFPVFIDCTYQQGRYDEHGVARHGYAAEADFIETPRQARYHYDKRFGIEASYRLSEQSMISTTTRNPVVWLLFVVISLLLQNAWRYLHWEFVSERSRGGRQLWWRPFTEFIDMVTQAVSRVLSVRQTVPMNRPPDDRFER